MTRRGPARSVLALVESPVQVLHVLEWCHTRQASHDTGIAVLAPQDPTSRTQVRAMTDFAAEEDIEVTWYEPRSSRLAGIRTAAALRPRLAAAQQLVVGDPFSGFIQALLPAVRTPEITVVDDGTATMEFVGLIAEGAPLHRWNAAGSELARLARRPLVEAARRFFTVRPGRRVEVFTVMPVRPAPGMDVHRHRYDWTRRRFGPPRTVAGTDIIGTSLVESGVVDAEGYLDGVAELAAGPAASGRYFAHRREDAGKLSRLARRTGLEVVRPTVPLEIELRRGSVGRRVVSFPSSVGYTLPLVLAGLPTSVSVLDIAPAWIRRDAGQQARGFLSRITDQVPGRAVAATCC